MDSKKKETVETYNNSAKELSKYFNGIDGPCILLPTKAFTFCNQKNPKILEVGCGSGRDAKKILKITKNYEGFDISKGMIVMAKNKYPTVNFFVADFEEYLFPDNQYDIVFAFASLLHTNKYGVKKVIKKISKTVMSGGLLFITLKEREKYQVETKEDRFGRRTFYFYTPELIESFAKEYFETVFVERQKIGKTNWFSILLRKK